MKIRISDHFEITYILPQKSTFLNMVLVRDILKKITLTQEEVVESGLESDPETGSVTLKKNIEKEVDFTSAELNFLGELMEVSSLSKQETFTRTTVDCFEKIIKLRDELAIPAPEVPAEEASAETLNS